MPRSPPAWPQTPALQAEQKRCVHGLMEAARSGTFALVETCGKAAQLNVLMSSHGAAAAVIVLHIVMSSGQCRYSPSEQFASSGTR